MSEQLKNYVQNISTCFQDIADCLTALKVIFFKKVPADTSAHITFANSLMAWGLLLTVASQSVVEEQIEK